MSLTASGTLVCFKRLLECNAPLEEVDNNGATPLHYGCQQDDDSKHVTARTEIVQILLEKGVNISTTDNEGRRPIHWASTSGSVFCCLLKSCSHFGKLHKSLYRSLQLPG